MLSNQVQNLLNISPPYFCNNIIHKNKLITEFIQIIHVNYKTLKH